MPKYFTVWLTEEDSDVTTVGTIVAGTIVAVGTDYG